MKFVTLILIGMMISFSATAQSTSNTAEKTATQKQQKTKGKKAKPAKTKVLALKNVDVVTLTDEKAHKAKWTFEEMLRRRLEVDAEDRK